MKRLLFFTGVVLVLFFACTSNDDAEYADNYYNLKAQELAESNGMSFKWESPTPMTKAEYEDLERLIIRFNEQKPDSIVLDLVEASEDGSFTFSNAFRRENVKTRSESMSKEYKHIIFVVSFSSKTSGGYSVSYNAKSDVYDIIRIKVEKEKIVYDEDLVSFNSEINVICKWGNGYLDMPFSMIGMFNVSYGGGEMIIKEK